MNTFKSCAICEHCDIGLGYSGGKSGYPTAGHFHCWKKHELPTHQFDLTDNMRVLAKNCPDFELMDEPE